MVKVLNREAIQRMGVRGAGSGGSGGSSEGGGGISLAQVDAAYVSKAFFDQLFTVHGKRTYTDPDTQEEVTEDVIISPNQIAEGEYSLSNVEVSVGLWTQQFLSALGLNSGGGGGGATSLTDLVDVALSNPQNGQVLMYNSITGKWYNGTVQSGGGGTVTSITAGTGLSGGTITSSGTIALNQETQTAIAAGVTAYGWGDHAQAGYLKQSALNGYATQQWVQQQGYLTSSALNGYATQQWVGQNYLGKNDTAAAATKLQTARKIWGQSFDGTGNITGDMEDVGVILQNGRYTVMGRNDAHGAMIESLTNSVTIGLHDGSGVGWDTRSGSGFMLQTVYDASNTVAKKYTRVYDGLRIGDGMLVWDYANNALKAIKADGTSLNFCATGGVSALGMSAGASTVDAMTFGYLTVNNMQYIKANNYTHKLYGNSNGMLVIDGSEGIMFNNDIHSNEYDIYTDGGNIRTGGGRIYLDSTRYIYVNGGTLYYFNGSTSRQIAFA